MSCAPRLDSTRAVSIPGEVTPAAAGHAGTGGARERVVRPGPPLWRRELRLGAIQRRRAVGWHAAGDGPMVRRAGHGETGRDQDEPDGNTGEQGDQVASHPYP